MKAHVEVREVRIKANTIFAPEKKIERNAIMLPSKRECIYISFSSILSTGRGRGGPRGDRGGPRGRGFGGGRGRGGGFSRGRGRGRSR